MALGRYDEAASALDRARERAADVPGIHETLVLLGFARGDAAAVDRETRWAAQSPETERTMLRFRAWASMRDGRRGEALSFLERAMVISRAGPPEQVAQVYADIAYIEMTAGNPRLVVEAARAATASSPSVEVRGLVAIPLAMAGQPELAREQLAGITPAPDVLFQQVVMGTGRAAVELSSGRPSAALRELDTIKRFELGIHAQLMSLWIRGETHLAAGDPRQAAATFQQVLDWRGVSPMSMHLALAELGLARARAGAGDAAGALRAYEALLARWAKADADLPVLAEIRRERNALVSAGRPTG
jgi:tetratricopeptide (TPR) repeat protein